jgi:DNA excision repair protein ERCC-2
MDLISKNNGKYLNLNSPFDSNKLDLIIDDSISTKYKDREATISSIAEEIEILGKSRKGNYIVCFPSYQYIELVLPHLTKLDTNIIVQTRDMSDQNKNEYLNYFKDLSESHLGLFVLGGSFSEGVDFQGDLLNGVIIVGVGLPQVNVENELLKEFFDEKYNQGFDYAYTYPGFNKVVQAAGRVIRTVNDYGVVILIDKRYKFKKYQKLMPTFWTNKKEIVMHEELENELEEFWLKYEK